MRHLAILGSLGCVFLATSTPANAQAPVRQAQEQENSARQERSDDEREAVRVMHLADGRIVRCKTRWNEGRWERFERGQWSDLGSVGVLRHQRERDLIKRAKDLLSKAEPGNDLHRVAAADWMLREGLVEEALEELDGVLQASPDQPAALELLARPPVPLIAPGASSEDPAQALLAAAHRPRAVQELAAAALARRSDAEALRAAVLTALHSPNANLRAYAALVHRRLYVGENARELLGRAVLDGSDNVRREAALTLRATGEEGVILPAVRALGSTHSGIRANAAEAIGNMGFAAGVEPLMARLSSIAAAPQGGGAIAGSPRSNIFIGKQTAYVQDFDVEVAQFSSIADPQINVLLEGAVLDVRVIGVYETSVAVESRQIRTALGRLTGANPGSSNKSWLQWWDENKHRWGVGPPPPAPPSGPTTPGR